MKTKFQYIAFIALLAILFSVSTQAAEPFLQEVTNGEVIHITFSDDGNLFVAIRNMDEHLIYNQRLYPVTAGNLSLMKISSSGSVEWIRDLKNNINSGVDYAENVRWGAPGVVGMETTSDRIYILASLNNSSVGARVLSFDHDGNFKKSLNVGAGSFLPKNMSLDGDDNPLVVGDISKSARAGGKTHNYWSTELRRLNMTDPRIELTGYDYLTVEKTLYDRFGDDAGTLKHPDNTYYVGMGAAAILADDSGNIYTISREAAFAHGGDILYTKPVADVVRNWHLDINDDSANCFNGGEHDYFKDKGWLYFYYDDYTASSNKWAGCDLYGDFNCSSNFSDHLNWLTTPGIVTSDNGHYNRNDGLFYTSTTGTHTFTMSNPDDEARLTVNGETLIETSGSSGSATKTLNAGYHWLTIEHEEDKGDQNFYFTIKDPDNTTIYVSDSDGTSSGTWYWLDFLPTENSGSISGTPLANFGDTPDDDILYDDHLNELLRTEDAFDPNDSSDPKNGARTVITKRNSDGGLSDVEIIADEYALDAVFVNSQLYIASLIVEPDAAYGLRLYALNTSLDEVSNTEATVEMQNQDDYGGTIISLETDASGNLYLFGFLSSGATADFKTNGTTSESISASIDTYFVAKLDSSLSWQWIKTPDNFTGTPRLGRFLGGLAVDPTSGDLYLGSSFKTGNLTIIDDDGEESVLSVGDNYSGFITALSSDGEWSAQATLTVTSDHGGDVIKPGIDDFTYLTGTEITVEAPDTIYVDSEGNILYDSETGDLLDDPDDEDAATRYICSGYTVGEQITEGETCSYSFNIEGDTNISFQWEIEHALEIYSDYEDEDISNAASDPSPTVGRHWIADGDQVTLQVDGAVYDSDDSEKRELLYEVDVDYTNWDPTAYTTPTKNSLKLNGGDGFVNIPNHADINTNGNGYSARTVEAWFKVDDKDVSDHKQIIYEEGGMGTGLNLYVYDGSLYVAIWVGSTWSVYLSTDEIESGEWHHAAIVFDGSSVTGYLDGDSSVFDTYSSNGTVSTMSSHGGRIAIGNRNNDTYFHDGASSGSNGHYLTGAIDDLRLWSTARTADEISDNMNVSLDGDESGLIAYYNFDTEDPASGTVPDKTGNGHDGTINGLNTDDIYEKDALRVALTPKDQRQQPLDFFMEIPVAITYKWKTQYEVEVNTTSYLYEDLPVTRTLDNDGNVEKSESGVDKYWFDKGVNIQMLMRETYGTKELDGWLYGSGLALDASGDVADLSSMVLDDGYTYRYMEIESLTKGAALTWNMKVLTLAYEAEIGDELDLTSIIEANKSTNGGSIDDDTLDNLVSDLTANNTLYDEPYNGFIIDGPGDVSYEDMFLWGEYDLALFPVIPGEVSLEWLVEPLDTSSTDATANVANFRVELTIDYPETAHYPYVIGTPAVDLDRAGDDSWAFVEMIYTDGKEDDGDVTDNAYSAIYDDTRSVLVFTCTDKEDETADIANGQTEYEPVCVRVVESMSMNESLSADAVEVPIGEVVSDNEHTASHSGYVYYDLARYNVNIYDRENLSGPIIPVNRQFTIDTTEDDLYIVWYTGPDDAAEIYEPIYWPFKTVQYTTRWPELTNDDHDDDDQALQRIVVASRYGSDGVDMYGFDQFKFDTDLYEDITIYNQPDEDAAGYNPNEEHAFLEASLMYYSDTPQPQAAFALRNDLNVVNQDETHTSSPYVLVQYYDVSEQDYRMWVYAVEMEDEDKGYTFDYTMEAGELVTAPYPLNMVLGATTPDLIWGHDGADGTQKVYWEDHKDQPWAISGDGTLYSYFWYPMKSDFWWPDNGTICYDSAEPADYAARIGDYGDNVYTWTDDQCVTVDTGSYVPYAIENKTNGGWEEIKVTYTTTWPDELPILRVGETLTHSGGEAEEDGDTDEGLPGVLAFSAGQIVFDSVNPKMDKSKTLTTYAARLAQVLDERRVEWTASTAFTDLFDATSGEIELYDGDYYFEDLPAGLQQRIFYDPTNDELVLRGFLDGMTIGDDDLTASPGSIYALQPNILTETEVETLKELNSDSGFATVIDNLYEYARDPNGISNDATDYAVGLEAADNGAQHESALGTGLALIPNDALLDPNDATLPDTMYVTLAENNHEDLGDAAISLHVIKIEKDNRYRGEIEILYPDNVFDEKINLRHTADFGANGEDIVFEWWYREDDGDDADPPDEAEAGTWSAWPDESGNNGLGMNEISLSDSGAALLSDNLFFVRYRHTDCDTDTSDDCWSDWAGAAENNPAKGVYEAQLAEGWVKRIIDAVNLFEARIDDFYSEDSPATYTSMIQQAGQRYNGDVALNTDKDVIENVGLIQLYQTVLERAKSLSIDASNPYYTSGISVALQLATSRLAQLYMLLGNEAYTDSLDPTIGFTTTSGEYGSLAPSIFTFMDQMPELIDEELALLRGRDEYGASPAYNRLIWNFTMGEGEVAYALSYNITDVDQDGFINEEDAATLYPQGHGDAWGHYLMALKYYYDLMQHNNYIWDSRSEMVSVDGVTVDVDFHDEQRFAEAAAARAKTGRDIVSLTYRDSYTEDPDGQWQGYKDTDTDRAWGVTEWAQRAFTGAYFDWVTANAVLPDENEDKTGIQKVDRTTVPDLREITAQAREIATVLNQADNGQTPLGLVPEVVPFDIDPVRVDRDSINPATHFEQIYERAEQALENAFRVFDYANNIKNRIREIADSTQTFLEQTYDQDMDYRNRLIEIFGTPYEGNIGTGETYPSGYDGPDIYFYNYIDLNEVSDETIPEPNDIMTGMFNANFSSVWEVTDKGGGDIDSADESGVTAIYSHFFPNDFPEGTYDEDDPDSSFNLPAYATSDFSTVVEIEFPVSAADYSFVAPDEWGVRESPGEIQDALIELVKAESDLQSALAAYSGLTGAMEWMVRQMDARSELNEDTLEFNNDLIDETETYNNKIDALETLARTSHSTTEWIDDMYEGAKEGLPKVVGFSNDTTSSLRSAIKNVAAFSTIFTRTTTVSFETAADIMESKKELLELQHALDIDKEEYEYDMQQQLRELEAMFGDDAPTRIAIFTARENMRQVSERYKSVLEKGLRLLEERQTFNQRTAAKAQGKRYKDMAFRFNQYEALQKYRATFDLAARYVYLAARAYDYETNLSEDDPASAQSLLSKIISERTLGMMQDGGAVIGYGGLAEILAQMKHNYGVLESRMGFNNPQTETGRFSLRKELFRIKDDQNDLWRDTLAQYRVENLWDISEFQRFCRNFAPESAGAQPGLVIPFSSTIESGYNFFGWPLSGGDHAYDASNFATRIRSVGVWFENYDNSLLSETPRVYLVPAGLDVMYVPDSFELDTREWDIVDQVIPVPLPAGQSNIAKNNWIPRVGTLSEDPTKIRRFSSFRAYHDSGHFSESEMSYDSRLVGRSVWNTRWLLIIPGATFLNDQDEGLDALIYGDLVPGYDNLRDGNGVSDIKLFFQTYAYSGN